jgi:hypothetical protein
LSSAGEVPVVAGTKKSRGSVSRSISSYSIGTELGLTATRSENDKIRLDVDLSKSTTAKSKVAIAESEDSKTYATEYRTLNFESNLSVDAGKTAVFTSSDTGTPWIVAFSAK